MLVLMLTLTLRCAVCRCVRTSTRPGTASPSRATATAAFHCAATRSLPVRGDNGDGERAEGPTRKRGRPRKEPPSASRDEHAPEAISEPTPRRAAAKTKRTSSTTTSEEEEPPLSTVAKGTAFEVRTLELLRTRFHMHTLERTGGAGDRGIDITGWWYPPAEGLPRVRVLVQCKASSTPLGPVYMRELEGTLYRKAFEARLSYRSAPAASSAGSSPDAGPRMVTSDSPTESSTATTATTFYREPVLGVLASTAGFSAACARYTLASPFPLLLLHIPTTDNAEGLRIPFAALPNMAFVHPRGLMDGRLSFRPTRKLSAAQENGGQAVRGAAAADPALTIDSPEIAFDGKKIKAK